MNRIPTEQIVHIVVGLFIVALVYRGGLPNWLLLFSGALFGIAIYEIELAARRAAARHRAEQDQAAETPAAADPVEAGEQR